VFSSGLVWEWQSPRVYCMHECVCALGQDYIFVPKIEESQLGGSRE
jgi:hypothetical protein